MSLTAKEAFDILVEEMKTMSEVERIKLAAEIVAEQQGAEMSPGLIHALQTALFANVIQPREGEVQS